MRTLHLAATACGLLACLFLGCADSESSKHPPVVKAGGVVLYQGQPVAGADVTFNNREANQTGTAQTDANGRFELSTFGQNDGVVPGHQFVAIRRVDVIDKTPPNVDVSAGGVAIPPEYRWIVPQKYSNATTSGLTEEVKAGAPNDFKFDLK